VAVLHLSPREREARIESKPIAYFVALLPEAGGTIGGELVKARVGNSDQPPVINLKITPRVP
jgi:hypothetical protein